MPHNRITVAVDIGGTFTDLELRDGDTGLSHSLKSPTTPDDPARGLAEALLLAAERFGFSMEDIGLILHGTTIATNAVLTRDLPEGALITTEGFEDVLEIGRHARRDIYALRGPDRSLLIPRRRRFGAPGRIGAAGEVVRPLDAASLEAVITRVAESGVKATAICLLNAFANPQQEIEIREALLKRCPDMAVSCSHEVSPEIREFERTATTVLNALLVPVIDRYVTAVRHRLSEAGVTAPVYLIQSNGGAISLEAAVQAPVKLLLSGPSGGVLAAQKLARSLETADVVGVDMGGTSYDVAVISAGQRTVVTQGEIDGLPVRVPMVEMHTIGAGGGSIAFVDASGRLQVGPRSAGAVPGPVCYGRGGQEPTVTDINLILGRLDPATFLGGRFALDLEGALAALHERMEVPLGLDSDHAAAGILKVVNAKLAASIKFSLFA
ncbi:MAG: hydantoinase/oxoprolinase family protein, partial [Sulfitobacter sp.]|nr:hydantoinase/oxoprolinase family protein [Sulfitobacter sp.]